MYITVDCFEPPCFRTCDLSDLTGVLFFLESSRKKTFMLQISNLNENLLREETNLNTSTHCFAMCIEQVSLE